MWNFGQKWRRPSSWQINDQRALKSSSSSKLPQDHPRISVQRLIFGLFLQLLLNGLPGSSVTSTNWLCGSHFKLTGNFFTATILKLIWNFSTALSKDCDGNFHSQVLTWPVTPSQHTQTEIQVKPINRTRQKSMFALTFCYTHSWYTSHKVHIAKKVFEVRPRRLRQMKTSLLGQMTENGGRTGFLAGARNSVGEWDGSGGRHSIQEIQMLKLIWQQWLE